MAFPFDEELSNHVPQPVLDYQTMDFTYTGGLQTFQINHIPEQGGWLIVRLRGGRGTNRPIHNYNLTRYDLIQVLPGDEGTWTLLVGGDANGMSGGYGGGGDGGPGYGRVEVGEDWWFYGDGGGGGGGTFLWDPQGRLASWAGGTGGAAGGYASSGSSGFWFWCMPSFLSEDDEEYTIEDLDFDGHGFGCYDAYVMWQGLAKRFTNVGYPGGSGFDLGGLGGGLNYDRWTVQTSGEMSDHAPYSRPIGVYQDDSWTGHSLIAGHYVDAYDYRFADWFENDPEDYWVPGRGGEFGQSGEPFYGGRRPSSPSSSGDPTSWPWENTSLRPWERMPDIVDSFPAPENWIQNFYSKGGDGGTGVGNGFWSPGGGGGGGGAGGAGGGSAVNFELAYSGREQIISFSHWGFGPGGLGRIPRNSGIPDTVLHSFRRLPEEGVKEQHGAARIAYGSIQPPGGTSGGWQIGSVSW